MKKFHLFMFLCVLVLAITGCRAQTFNGSCISNETEFILDYTYMSDTLTHEMQLKQDATINVDIEDTSGRVDILITDADGEEIYRGDDASSGNFSIKITKKGTYGFSVTGKRAKGGVSFIVEE